MYINHLLIRTQTIKNVTDQTTIKLQTLNKLKVKIIYDYLNVFKYFKYLAKQSILM